MVVRLVFRSKVSDRDLFNKIVIALAERVANKTIKGTILVESMAYAVVFAQLTNKVNNQYQSAYQDYIEKYRYTLLIND